MEKDRARSSSKWQSEEVKARCLVNDSAVNFAHHVVHVQACNGVRMQFIFARTTAHTDYLYCVTQNTRQVRLHGLTTAHTKTAPRCTRASAVANVKDSHSPITPGGVYRIDYADVNIIIIIIIAPPKGQADNCAGERAMNFTAAAGQLSNAPKTYAQKPARIHAFPRNTASQLLMNICE